MTDEEYDEWSSTRRETRAVSVRVDGMGNISMNMTPEIFAMLGVVMLNLEAGFQLASGMTALEIRAKRADGQTYEGLPESEEFESMGFAYMPAPWAKGISDFIHALTDLRGIDASRITGDNPFAMSADDAKQYVLAIAKKKHAEYSAKAENQRAVLTPTVPGDAVDVRRVQSGDQRLATMFPMSHDSWDEVTGKKREG